MVEAAQPAFLVAPEGKRGSPVQAILTEHAEPALRIAEDDQVFAEKPRAHRRAVALGHFLGHAQRQPVAPHDAAHRRIAFDAAEKLVLFHAQHILSLLRK